MDDLALLRALASEERARNASDAAIKREWEAIAAEWHLLANTDMKVKNKNKAAEAKRA